jgi:hypothetical protein
MTSHRSLQEENLHDMGRSTNNLESQGQIFSIRNRLRSASEEYSSSEVKRPSLPFEIRMKVYSYMDLMSLINQVSKLSKYERMNIVRCIRLLDQPRALLINIVAD